MEGYCVRNNVSINYNGSMLYVPISQYELPILTKWCIMLSELINNVSDRYIFPIIKIKLHVNFRFVSDYRYWIISLILFVIYKIVSLLWYIITL